MDEYHPTSPKDQSRNHQFGKKVLPGIFLGSELIAGRIWKEFFYCRFRRFGKVGCIKYLSSKNQREGSIDLTKRWWIHIPRSRWYSKTVRKRLRCPRTHSKAATDRKEWRSQWRTSRRIGRVSTGRINRWRRSPFRLLVDSRWLRLSPSQWNSSSTLRAGRNILYSTEMYWCSEVYSYWSWRHARKTYRRLLDCRFEQTFVRFVERFHKVHSTERETYQRIYVVRGKTDKDSNDCQTRSCMARSLDENW